MTEEITGLFNKYMDYLKMKKYKSRKTALKFELKVFFNYIDENNLDYTKLRIPEADNFRSYLVKLTNENGSARYSKKTINHILAGLKRFYKYLKYEKIVYTNAFNEVEFVREGKSLPRNILNEEKFVKLLDYFKNFNNAVKLTDRKLNYKAHVILEFMYSTGCRIDEVSKLKPDDIDFERGTARIKEDKAGKTRYVFLNEYCLNVLRQYMEIRKYLMITIKGIKSSLLFGSKESIKRWFNYVVNKASNNLGLGRFTSHNVRHTVGYHLLKNGCDIRYIKEILGHSSIDSTRIYTKVDKDDLKSIIDNYHPRGLLKRGVK